MSNDFDTHETTFLCYIYSIHNNIASLHNHIREYRTVCSMVKYDFEYVDIITTMVA